MRTLALLLCAQIGQLQFAQVTNAQRPATKTFQVDALDSAKRTPGQINALVPEAVVQLFGHKSSGSECTGTGFILRQTDAKQPRNNTTVLISALHVFENCVEGNGTIKVRFRHPSDDPLVWRLDDQIVRVLDGKHPLWVQHPTQDIAVLPIAVPEGAVKTLLPTSLLACWKDLQAYYIGSDVLAVGYPLGTALNPSGYPILRSAKIASPALAPNSPFEVSFQVYPGDSGAPLYAIEKTEDGYRIVILGIIIRASAVRTMEVAPKGDPRAIFEFTGVAVVVPSTEVLKTLKELPKLRKDTLHKSAS